MCLKCYFYHYQGRLWHRLDDRYCMPKANLKLLLRNPAIQYKWVDESQCWTFDAEAGVQTGLILDAFADALAQNTYNSYLAGLNWSLKKSASGLMLECSGYSQHLTEFALDIFKQFYTEEAPFLTEKHVRTNKDKSIRFLESYLKSNRANSYASYIRSLLLLSRGHGVEESLEITKLVDEETLRAHHHLLITLACTKVDCLISGNVAEDKAKRFFHEIQKITNDFKVKCNHNPVSKNFQDFVPGKCMCRAFSLE